MTRDAGYEPPTIVVLGTIAEVTQLDQPGPNADAFQNAPSAP